MEKKEEKKEKKNLNYIVIILLLIIIIIILLLRGCNGCSNPITENPTIKMDTSQGSISDDPTSDSEIDYTTFPGYGTINVAKNNVVQLINPEKNTVNFVYAISEIKSSKQVFEGSVEDADRYMQANEKKYSATKEGNEFFYTVGSEKKKTITDYKMSKADGKAVIEEQEKEILFISDGIAPGNSVKWTAPKKNANIIMTISTFDVSTNEPCIGTNISARLKA